MIPFWQAASPSRVNATIPARTTLGADVERAVPAQPESDTRAADAAIAIRTEVSGRARGARPAARLRRRALRAQRAEQKRLDAEARERHELTHPLERARLAEIAAASPRIPKMGYLASWLSPGVVFIVLAAMLANDPVFVVTTLRTVLDVPADVPLWAVWNLDVLLTIAAAVGLSAILIGFARLAGKALGTVIFRGRLLAQKAVHTEVEQTQKDLGIWRPLVLAGLGVAGVVAATVFLSVVAHARFEGDIASAFAGGAETANRAVTVYIAALPAVVLVLEMIAAVPSFEHARSVMRSVRRMRRRERAGIRRDQRMLRRSRRLVASARRALDRLLDMLDDVRARSRAETIEAALVTGRPDIAGIASAYAVERGAHETVTHELRGGIDTGYIRVGEVSHAVASALEAWDAVAQVPASSPLAAFWRELRENPLDTPVDAPIAAPVTPLHPVTAPADDAAEHLDTATLS